MAALPGNQKTGNLRRSNRRSSLRKPGRRSIRLQCRRGALGLGANVSSSFTDISENGLQLITREPVKLGDEVELILDGYGMAAVRRIGEVRWIEPTDGGCRAGVRFAKPIPFRDVQNLSAPQ